jgi:D-arabinan endo alpha-(1,5)-arabinofuranosidase
VANADAATLRARVLRRLRSGETAAAIAADCGISRSTVYRWKRESYCGATLPGDGYVCDITGPGVTDRWGVTATDLGVCAVAPNGKLVSVFGDTFSGPTAGQGDWRAPVALIGTGDTINQIRYESSGGADPDYARQLWPYIHDGPPWSRSGISTVIPSDVLVIGKTMYLHAIVNRGFGNVIWTGVWTSSDNGVRWHQMGSEARFPALLHDGHAQLWSWDYNPDDGWVYVVSTGFQRDKGIILRRVRPGDVGRKTKYSGWGWANDQWAWGNEPTPITPPGETWGELTLRRLDTDAWILGGFLSSEYALGYRTIDSPTANLYEAEVQTPVVGTSWDAQDLANSRVAQLYGGYVLPGSRLDAPGGVGLVVSQWNTATGWPYRAMQFRVTLKDTTRTSTPRRPRRRK